MESKNGEWIEWNGDEWNRTNGVELMIEWMDRVETNGMNGWSGIEWSHEWNRIEWNGVNRVTR